MTQEGRMLQVRMSEEGYAALRTAGKGVRLESRSALVRAFADAVARKSARELRMFLFFDEDELSPKSK